MDFEIEHAKVLEEANAIYKKKSQTRGQLWLETSLERELQMIEEKMRRAQRAMLNGLDDEFEREEFLDSCLDSINFLAFAVKKMRRGIIR
jgi:hypothetical protein